MTELQLARTLSDIEQREEDLQSLYAPAKEKPAFVIRMAAHKAAEKAALRRKYIAKGIARQQED
jgi:hypothetical protein